MIFMRVLIVLFCIFAISSHAQQLPYPTDTIDGKVYYQYTVERGVGLYRVSKIFNIPQESILEANPTIQNSGMVFGSTILIPMPVSNVVEPNSQSKKHRTCNNDTLSTTETIVDDTVIWDNYQVDTLRLALMLPLHATSIKRSSSMERFMDFYMGALIAIYETQQAGLNIQLYTYDVEKNTDRLEEILVDSIWHKVDAIIGPAYAQQVKQVAQFTEKDSCWLLVPFISGLTEEFVNPNILQFNPSMQTEAKVFAEYLANSVDSINCVLIQSKEGENIPNSIKCVHDVLQEYNIATTTTTIREILLDSMETALVENKENIIIFNTEKYNNLQAVIPHLLPWVGKYNITLYSRYSWQNEKIILPQIYTSVFHEVLGVSETYDAIYKQYFKVEPSAKDPRYDLLGYDLTKHLIYLLQQSDTRALQESWMGVQSAIQYNRSLIHSGYENQKISVIRK